MKRILAIMLMLTCVFVLAAQEVEEFNATETEDVIKLEDTKAAKPKEKPAIELEDIDEEDDQDIIKVNYQKKSAALAMALSAVIPGFGSIYADYSSWTGYVFPVIEACLWVGYAHYQNEGLNKESDYEDFANHNYNRQYYQTAMTDLKNQDENDIYDDNHFRLDIGNTQHFYEDIGKYNKYVFGWTDWYAKYGHDNTFDWEFDSDGTWLGNKPTDGTAVEGQYDRPYSNLREDYIHMRQDAEDSYDRADYVTWGIMANHVIAILDAYRVTRAYNVEYLSQAPRFQFNVQPVVCNERITPMLMTSWKF